MRNLPIGVGARNVEGYLVKEESLDGLGQLRRYILERPLGGSPYTAQKKVNAFNFPFTGNPGSGCFFQCVYCYLRQPFFQRHITADHGREIYFLANMLTGGPDRPHCDRRHARRRGRRAGGVSRGAMDAAAGR